MRRRQRDCRGNQGHNQQCRHGIKEVGNRLNKNRQALTLSRDPILLEELAKYAPQLDRGMRQSGAAVESTTYASIARDVRKRSVTAFIVAPTVNEFR